MSNDLIPSSSGAATVEPTTEGAAGDFQQGRIASRSVDVSRRAEIESIMRTDFDRYDRELRREYLELLEAEQEERDPDGIEPTRPMHPDAGRESLCGTRAGRELVGEWDRYGAFNSQYEGVQKAARAIVADLGGYREQRVFMERFDRAVPEEARMQVYRELSYGKPSFVRPSSVAEVSLFAGTPAGSKMVEEWGGDAPEAVAILRQRAARLDSAMGDDADYFWQWFSDLPTDTIASIYRRIVGGGYHR